VLAKHFPRRNRLRNRALHQAKAHYRPPQHPTTSRTQPLLHAHQQNVAIVLFFWQNLWTAS